jgi:peptidoglycan/LPS O-acetylase OafA/YrhL
MMVVYIIKSYVIHGKGIEFGKIVSSTLFIFNLIPQHVTGFVWASWSIGVEMAFYFILPVLAFVITTPARAAAFVAIAMFLSNLWGVAFKGATGDLQHFGNFALVSYLGYFAAGILAFFVWDRLKEKAPSAGTPLVIAGLALFVANILSAPGIGHLVNALGVKPMQALMLAVFVIGMALSPTKLIVNRVTKALGEASFSLYLWHPFIISILMRNWVYLTIYQHVPNHGLAFAGCAAITLLIVIPVALVSYRWIEVPGNRLSARVIAANGDWNMNDLRSNLAMGLRSVASRASLMKRRPLAEKLQADAAR